MNQEQKLLDAWKLVRRSGIAVTLMSHFLEWVPDSIYQVGVGLNCQEVEVFKIAWPGVPLVGFEAHPSTVEAIRKRYPGTLHATAVSNFVGDATLWVKPRHRDGASLLPFEESIDSTEIKVLVSTLDKLVPSGPPSSKTLLWLDCEGSELNAIEGGLKFIENVEVINIEMTGKPSSAEWPDQVKVHLRLRELGFFMQWIHTQRSAAGQVDLIYCREHLFREQYCCCPYSVLDYRTHKAI